MRSGNPVLTNDTFNEVRSYDSGHVMSIQGTTNKSFILLFLVMLTAIWAWSNPGGASPFLLPALVGGFLTALVTVFKKEWSPITAPLYALLEGVVLGTVSVIFEQSYPGIVKQAVGLTGATLCALLIVYRSGMITVTDQFRMGIVAATGGIALYYLLTLVLGFFQVRMPLIYDSGPIGIGFSLIVVIIAALNLVLDFDFIEQGSRMGVPKYMEWYGAFGLMVTLIWLYMEILRFLSKLRRR
ncbi:MAG TPA: Bax inhibitor-1/YccA family protein [Candidatus Omnitrophota bacterium]|nr:Bax inhibitor-1/YccA family protein [Candidatus Omnitrophota bacterium]HPB69295.1 Bax inhibitor-1/YccA family protein [Candidatus Omnitrophota bacterium]HQO57862.1 Bax inhibitor-1/YccA family protein [Candidatus Omnitrophota bacterium]HQP11900.1 Bax inhibitor-1/YccA family protein [Candidatus Omnitrophota bacterium]